jgi:hypothetical protein
MTAQLTQGYTLLADAQQISNDVVIHADHTRASTTFWFTILISFFLLALARKVDLAMWVLYCVLFLGFVVIISTWLPGLGIGNSIRSAWQNLYDGGGFGKLIALVLVVALFGAAYWAYTKIVHPDGVLELVLGIVAAFFTTVVFCTIPAVQSAAVWYVDTIVVPIMNFLWGGH